MTTTCTPSEEERRLLREYRLTKVPSRRSSTSPGISKNSGSSTTNTTTTADATTTTTATTTATTTTSTTNTNNGNSHAANQHGHHHHHHHSSNHKRHKSITPTHELTTDELNRMLELVSELDYLKLVSPKIIPNNINNNGINSTETEAKPSNTTSNGHSNETNQSNIPTITTMNGFKSSYIFEKVDYIKKISLQREAFRKLRKARNKSRLSSPNTTRLNTKTQKV